MKWVGVGYTVGISQRCGPKSIKTEEARIAYVTKGLKREREALGLEPIDNPMAVIKLRRGQTFGKPGTIHQSH